MMSDSLINSVSSVVTKGMVQCNFLIFHFSNTVNAKVKRSYLLCIINFVTGYRPKIVFNFVLLEATLLGNKNSLVCFMNIDLPSE